MDWVSLFRNAHKSTKMLFWSNQSIESHKRIYATSRRPFENYHFVFFLCEGVVAFLSFRRMWLRHQMTLIIALFYLLAIIQIKPIGRWVPMLFHLLRMSLTLLSTMVVSYQMQAVPFWDLSRWIEVMRIIRWLGFRLFSSKTTRNRSPPFSCIR